jgi:hypothetical protein
VAAREDAKATPRKRAKSPERPYPRVTLEQALRVPSALKDKNAGNSWASDEVAKALGVGAKSARLYYLTAGARDYGLTLGTRETGVIELTDLGRQAVYPSTPEERTQALHKAFFRVDAFRKVFEYYKGNQLPEEEFLTNTLQKVFNLDPEVHDEFVDIFQKNCRYLGLASPDDVVVVGTGAMPGEAHVSGSGAVDEVITVAKPKKGGKGLLCFVIMPFTERSEEHDVGFFGEVLASLIAPAAKEAGFTVRSAQRHGSDVIQKTIVNDLLKADLVVADLTEHNPNVMFELGMRMAHDLPVALIRAKGTGSIFDVDNMLRVYDYDQRMWPSTIAADLPNLQEHIQATWDNRDSENTYMKLLGRAPVRS